MKRLFYHNGALFSVERKIIEGKGPMRFLAILHGESAS